MPLLPPNPLYPTQSLKLESRTTGGARVWRDGLLPLHRLLHAIVRVSSQDHRAGAASDAHHPLTDSPSKVPRLQHNQRSSSSSSLSPEGPPAADSREAYATYFLVGELRVVGQLLRQVSRCLIQCLARLGPNPVEDITFSFYQTSGLNLSLSSSSSSDSSWTSSSPHRKSHSLSGSGPVLASPDLLTPSSRCDIANALLDVYEVRSLTSCPYLTPKLIDCSTPNPTGTPSITLWQESLGLLPREDRESLLLWGEESPDADSWFRSLGGAGLQPPTTHAEEPVVVARRAIRELLKGLHFEGALASLGPGALPPTPRVDGRGVMTV